MARPLAFAAAAALLLLLVEGASAYCTAGQRGCTKCQNNRCVECQPIGWDLHPARHICVKCWRTNCAACDARRPAQCLRCRDGYYRSSAGLCKKCKARCTSCLNRSGWCVDCMEPYYPHQGRCVLEVEDPLPRDPKLDQEPY